MYKMVHISVDIVAAIYNGKLIDWYIIVITSSMIYLLKTIQFVSLS